MYLDYISFFYILLYLELNVKNCFVKLIQYKTIKINKNLISTDLRTFN